jgi:hypothetical protein
MRSVSALLKFSSFKLSPIFTSYKPNFQTTSLFFSNDVPALSNHHENKGED